MVAEKRSFALPVLSLSKLDNFPSCIFSNSSISKVVFLQTGSFQNGKFIELLMLLRYNIGTELYWPMGHRRTWYMLYTGFE